VNSIVKKKTINEKIIQKPATRVSCLNYKSFATMLSRLLSGTKSSNAGT
jgi:hypothetical protein